MRTTSLLICCLGTLVGGCHYYEYGCDERDHRDRDDECGWECAGAGDAGASPDAHLSFSSDASSIPADAGPSLPVPACSSDLDCDQDELCLEGSCVPRGGVCRSDDQCGPDRGCVDGACRPRCVDSTTCPSGTRCELGLCLPAPECEDSSECGAGEVCVERRCLPLCSDEDRCPHPEDVCAPEGVCRPDVGPRPFCLRDADCARGRLCLDNVCRTPCPTGEVTECRAWDAQFVRCAAGESGVLLCFTRQQVDPQCLTAADCAAGERCIDAFCQG